MLGMGAVVHPSSFRLLSFLLLRRHQRNFAHAMKRDEGQHHGQNYITTGSMPINVPPHYRPHNVLEDLNCHWRRRLPVVRIRSGSTNVGCSQAASHAALSAPPVVQARAASAGRLLSFSSV